MAAATMIIRCSNCGAKNRISSEEVVRGLAPVCGRCKELLPLVTKPTDVTDATFAREVEGSKLPVLVDAWAPWCGPCKMIEPVIDQLALEFAGRIRVSRLNVDENQRTATRLKISGIPALLIFNAGREVDRLVGIHPKPHIAERLQKVMA